MLTLIWLMGIPLLLIAIALFFSACSGNDSGSKSVYVKPSIDYKGKFRKLSFVYHSIASALRT
jgi:hypothetical protein